MTSDSGISGDIKDYPFLTKEEFAEACHHLDRRYTQATLGPVRRLWRLSTCTALDTTFVFDDAAYTTYVQITRPLEEQPDLDLSADLGSFSFASETDQADQMVMGDQDMVEAEDMDEAALVKKPRQVHTSGHVTYEIHLHPTYRAPCLWFSLHGLPVDEVAFSIDTVYRRLVPDQFKDVLRSAGGIGGISADHHPVTGVPCFFVHPCVLGEAMQSFRCTRENYLMIWLGFVGPTVGLWVPKEMAIG